MYIYIYYKRTKQTKKTKKKKQQQIKQLKTMFKTIIQKKKQQGGKTWY